MNCSHGLRVILLTTIVAFIAGCAVSPESNQVDKISASDDSRQLRLNEFQVAMTHNSIRTDYESIDAQLSNSADIHSDNIIDGAGGLEIDLHWNGHDFSAYRKPRRLPRDKSLCSSIWSCFRQIKTWQDEQEGAHIPLFIGIQVDLDTGDSQEMKRRLEIIDNTFRQVFDENNIVTPAVIKAINTTENKWPTINEIERKINNSSQKTVVPLFISDNETVRSNYDQVKKPVMFTMCRISKGQCRKDDRFAWFDKKLTEIVEIDGHEREMQDLVTEAIRSGMILRGHEPSYNGWLADPTQRFLRDRSNKNRDENNKNLDEFLESGVHLVVSDWFVGDPSKEFLARMPPRYPWGCNRTVVNDPSRCR